METNEILANAEKISLTEGVTADHNQLCNLWPTVKQGLQILSGLVNNPVVKVIIGTVIAAGDAIIGRICN